MHNRRMIGASVVEYGLLVSAIALASVVSMGQLRDGVARMLGGVTGGVSGMSRCIDAQSTDFCRPDHVRDITKGIAKDGKE